MINTGTNTNADIGTITDDTRTQFIRNLNYSRNPFYDPYRYPLNDSWNFIQPAVINPLRVNQQPFSKNIVVFDVIESNVKKNTELEDLDLNTNGMKTYTINFSTNDEKDVFDKLKDMNKKKRILVKYFFETENKQYKGSVFVDTEESLIVHYYPDFFSKDIRENILSFVMIFIKKSKKRIFDVYNEHHGNDVIRYKQDEDDSAPGKQYIKTLMGNINNKVRTSFLGRNEFFKSNTTTFYTNQQKVLSNYLLLNSIRNSLK